MFKRNVLSLLALGAFVALASGSGDSSEDEWDEMPAEDLDAMNEALWPAEEAAPAAPANEPPHPGSNRRRAFDIDECWADCMGDVLGGPDYNDLSDDCHYTCGIESQGVLY